MKKLSFSISYASYSFDELTDADRRLVDAAIEATARSYSPYSHFSVGAALLLADGRVFPGCNQENAAFPVTVCAERSALFAAGAACPEVAPVALAIAARDASGQLTSQPVPPCGVCRQALVEAETRYHRPVRLLLVGRDSVYLFDGIAPLMPFTFNSF